MTRLDKLISYITKGTKTQPSTEVVVGKNLDDLETLRLAGHDNVSHVIQEEREDLKSKIQASINILNMPYSIFEKTFETVFFEEDNTANNPPNEIHQLELPFHSSTQKSIILNHVEAFLKSNKISSTLRSRILLVCDELFTNALFNAPVERSHKRISRTQKIHLNDELANILKIGISGDKLAVVCQDKFGSLNTKKYINHLASKYDKNGKNLININEDGGAGIGSFLMYGYCQSMYLGVKEDQETLFCFVFSTDRKKNYETNQPKSIHLSTP